NPAFTSVGYTTDPFTTTSWVHGKLSRRLAVTGTAYEFPVGKIDGDSLYAPVKMLKQNSGPATYSAQYFPDMPVNRTSINPFFHHISSVEYWEITSHNYAVPADNYAKLSLSWRTYSDVSSNPVDWDSLVIAHYLYPGGAQPFIWEPEYVSPLAVIQPGSTVNFGYFTNEKFIGDYSMPHMNFTIGTRTINNALPVTLLDYQVELVNNQSALNTWKVTNDTRVDRYQVERSADNSGFIALGNVAARRSSGISQYHFTDAQPLRGWNYYRLKIFEDNGVRYSPTRKVFIGSGNIFTLYPNPASDFIYVVLPVAGDSRSSLSLIDNNGRIISTLTPQSTTVRLSLTKLAAGVYHIRYLSGENVYSRSFIHQ
ncbi:MAG TPA: T9SS type A sorting domain-containing protein, partial [Chitinophagaceae bacterium]